MIQVEEDRDEFDLEGDDESSKEDGDDDFVPKEMSAINLKLMKREEPQERGQW